MTEINNEVIETQTETKKKNGLGNFALIASIIGLLLTLSIFGVFIGVPLLGVALLIGIIALFKAPRTKAIFGVVISGITLATLFYLSYWMIDAVKDPIMDFVVEISDKYKNDAEFQLVANQPGFEKFVEARVEQSLKGVDAEIREAAKDLPLKEKISYFLTVVLEEVSIQIDIAKEEWIQLYGLPISSENLYPIDENIPDLDEWRRDDDLTIE